MQHALGQKRVKTPVTAHPLAGFGGVNRLYHGGVVNEIQQFNFCQFGFAQHKNDVQLNEPAQIGKGVHDGF